MSFLGPEFWGIFGLNPESRSPRKPTQESASPREVSIKLQHVQAVATERILQELQAGGQPSWTCHFREMISIAPGQKETEEYWRVQLHDELGRAQGEEFELRNWSEQSLQAWIKGVLASDRSAG